MKKHTRQNRRNFTRTQTGIVRANARGFAFVTPDGGGNDFFVPKKSLCGAYHGDKVKFAHVAGTEDEALILSVIRRNLDDVVGTIVKDGRRALLYPDDARLPTLFIPADMLYGAAHGQKARCSKVSFPKGRAPTGKVEEILGDEGELFAEQLSIIRAFALRDKFPAEVQKEAQICANERIDTVGRRDLRGKIIFTIDGEDTRDIDDAVSLEKEGENYVLGVHIADVSHYVKEGGECDKEAYLRGTSVYFPDRVLPMLPKELSNGACSLNDGETRLAISCEMVFDGSGNRLSYDIFESVIKSVKKTSYNEVFAVYNGDEKALKELKIIAPTINLMAELCLILENKRKRNSIDLDVKEAHICLDESKNIQIFPAERTLAHRIIEQFMIAANEAVAEFLAARKYPCLYRVHERPDPEKVQKLKLFLRSMGISENLGENSEPRDFEKIISSIADQPKAAVVNKVILRSMQKARYCGDNLKHFGLGSDCYCHFTSPIRRYPDLFVHRRIKELLHSSPLTKGALGGYIFEAGAHLSECERRADEAERKVDDLYKLAYMSERLGEEFEGIISGVTQAGIFCELENTVEGLIPFEDLPADSYELDENFYILKGRKHKFRLGDRIKVMAADCDLGRLKTLLRLCG